MQLRRSTIHAEYTACKSYIYKQSSGGEYYGSCAVYEYHAVWYVHNAVESNGSGSNGSGIGRFDSYAMHTGNGSTVDSRLSDGFARLSARIKQYIYFDVYVGRRNNDNVAGAIHGNDTLKYRRKYAVTIVLPLFTMYFFTHWNEKICIFAVREIML